MPLFNRHAKQITDAYSDINLKSDQVAKKSGALSGALGGVGKTMLGLGGAAATAAVAGVGTLAAGMTALGIASVQTAADFEEQMAILSTAVDPAQASLNDLKEAALGVGADTELVGVSASEAADAMTGLYKAGLDTTDIFGDLQGYLEGTTSLSGALRAAVDLQAASELDLAAASDVVAVAMATFGLSAEDATRISDNFVQAADASVASVADLAEAMKNVGPTAAAFGFSLEDTNNALAILSTRGINGAEAGTALKSMLTNIMRPTDAVTSALKDMNVSLYNADGTMRQLPQILADLERGMAGMTEEQRNATVQTLAGTFGMKAMQTLLEEGVEGWAAMAQATRDASSAGDVAQARTDTFKGKLEALQGVFETLKIRIGDVFLPILSDLLEKFAEFVSQHGPQVEAAFQAVADVISDLLGVLVGEVAPEDVFPPALVDLTRWLQEKIPQAIQTLKTFWENTLLPMLRKARDVWEQDLHPAFLQIKAWLEENVPKAIQTLKDFWENTLLPIFQTFKDAWETTLEPAFTELGLAFADLWLALSDAWTQIAPILADLAGAFGLSLGDEGAGGEAVKFSDVVGSVADTVAFLVRGLADVIKFVARIITKAVEGLAKFWKKHGDTIVAVIEGVGDTVKEVFGIIEKMIQGDWEGAWKDAKKILDKALGLITDLIDEAFDHIKEKIANTLREILRDLYRKWEEIKDTVREALANIRQNVQSAWDEIRGTISDFLAGIRQDVESAWAAIQDAIQGALGDIQAAVEGAWADIRAAIEGAMAAIQSTISNTWNTIQSNIASVLSNIGSEISRRFNDFLTNIGSVLATIRDVVEARFQEINDAVRARLMALAAIPGQIADTLRGIGAAIIEHILAGLQAVTDFAARVKDQLAAWFEDVRTQITSSFAAGVAVGRELVERILIGIRSWVSGGVGFAGWLADWLRDRFDDLLSGASSMWNRVKDIGEEIVDSIKQGIKDAWDDFIDWLRGRIGAIPDALGFSPIPSAIHLGRWYAASFAAGFASQERAMAASMARVVSGLALPALQATVGAPCVAAPALGAAGGTVNNYNTFQLGGNTISSGMGEAEFEARVLRVIRSNL